MSRYRPRLRRWAAGRVPNALRGRLDTEDLVQDALLRTISRLDAMQRSGAFQAYLRTAVLNGLRDAVRKKRETLLDDPSPIVDDGRTPAEIVIGRDLLRRYERALQDLGERERAAVISRLEWSMPYRDLADELDYPSPDAARVAVARALVKLAERMRTLHAS